MANTSPPAPDTSAGEPERKKRKTRKGTQSCWECKRRKIRCIFSAPNDDVCDGCMRRKTRCIGQEFPDNPGPADTNRHLEDRLQKVEEALDQLKKYIPSLVQSNGRSEDEATNGLMGEEPDLGANTSNTVSPGFGSSIGHDLPGSRFEDRVTDTDPSILPLPEPQLRSTVLVQEDGPQVANKYHNLCRILLNAWPNQHDLQLILNARIGTLGLPHLGLCCLSCSESQEVNSPKDLLKLPSPDSHPVLIARRLLTLGSILQAMLPYATKDLADLSVSCQRMMIRAVETAISLVTSNDRLVSSIEGIECIMLEAMYHNGAGNLRRAWLTIRRAMMVAQMMGLQRGNDSMSLKVVDLMTRARLKPLDIWFRIVQADRYFSLVLGLPQGVIEDSFATPQELGKCTPIERMQRINCVAAGRILQRNATDLHSLTATREIDKILEDASAAMPPQWWLIPDLSSSAVDEEKFFSDTVRLMQQCAHYILLAQLHLPFMLRVTRDRKYDHSKAIAVNASREVLSRFTAFRSLNLAGYYCRGLDFLAFIASTVLCLAYINCHSQRNNVTAASDAEEGCVLGFLAHQRSSDRGMMERALEALENTDRENVDAISSKIAGIFRHLLAMELDAASGSSYSTDCSPGADEQEFERAGTLSDCGKVLNIYVPYFGTVKVKHGSVSKSALIPPNSWNWDLSLPPPTGDGAAPIRQPDNTNAPFVERGTFAYTDSPSGQINLLSSELQSSESWDRFMAPDLSAGPDDWALQGVDMAFFDSIIRGMGESDTTNGEIP